MCNSLTNFWTRYIHYPKVVYLLFQFLTCVSAMNRSPSYWYCVVTCLCYYSSLLTIRLFKAIFWHACSIWAPLGPLSQGPKPNLPQNLTRPAQRALFFQKYDEKMSSYKQNGEIRKERGRKCLKISHGRNKIQHFLKGAGRPLRLLNILEHAWCGLKTPSTPNLPAFS